MVMFNSLFNKLFIVYLLQLFLMVLIWFLQY